MNILDGPRLKLNCAKKHLEALDEGIDSFIEQNPTVVTLDINIGRELQTFHLRLPSSSVPLELSILAGHAVHDMRSALDWLVCRLSEQEGADSLEGIEFPIFKSSPGPRLERKIRFLSNESKEAIRLLQPHFTEARYGHSAEIQMLWELHRLDITDKHRGLLGKGILVSPIAVINSKAVIGDGCICNTGSIVEHECELGDYVHLGPSATLCGNVKVGAGTLIGANSVVSPGIIIGSNVIIGAGSVVVSNIRDGKMVAGNPS
ncbi:MAG: acetyltransferase, partial [Chloroflexi bacterium]|nr:acetyltransferase [Chloroflexota bacterium]